MGTTDSVALATGLIGPLRPGREMRGTGLTVTDPIPPPFMSPHCTRGPCPIQADSSNAAASHER